MSNDLKFLIGMVLVLLAIALGWYIVHRKRQQQRKQREEQAVSERLICADCGAELKPMDGDGNQDIYECPNCNPPGNSGNL